MSLDTSSVAGSTDLANGDITVKVVAGAETQVTYTDAQASATFKVCKWSGAPSYQGASYSFTVLGQVLTAVAGPDAADAGCSSPISVQPGAKFSVSEAVPAGQLVAGIVAGGTAKVTSSSGGVAQVTAGSGANIVTYEDEPVGPPQTGWVEVCKDNLDGFVSGSFTFTIKDSAGLKDTEVVPVGQCSGPVKVASGNVDISETAVAGVYVSSIFTIPAGNLGPNNPTNGTATVVVVPSSSSNLETQVHFVNAAQLGSLKICKVLTSSSGALAGSTFTFTVSSPVYSSVNVTIVASTSANGACKNFQLPFPLGTVVTVTEAGVPFVAVSPGGTVGAGGSQTATIAAGINTVSFTNQAYGTIEVCKKMAADAADQAFNGTPFTFTVNGGASFPVRAGLGCSGPITVPTGTATVAETVPANFAFVSATGTDPSGSIDRTVPAKSSTNPLTVSIPYPGGGGNETLVTYTDKVLTSTFKLCKLIDPGSLTPLGGLSYTFNWSYTYGISAANPAGTTVTGTNTVMPPYTNPGGSCTDILGNPTGGTIGIPVVNPNGTPTTITVVEQGLGGIFKVSTITVDNGAATTNTATGTATVTPNPGIVTITYTNTHGSSLFWTNFHSTTVGRAAIDGTSVNQSFITGPAAPVGIAVGGNFIYWDNQSTDTISRANLDGTGVIPNFITGLSQPWGLAVDGSFIYWTNEFTGTIGRANLDGTGVNQNFITGLSQPVGLAVDSGHIYWANFGANTIGRANLDGTGANQTFITGAANPTGVAVDGSHIYWGNDGTAVGRANLDGTGVNQAFITASNVEAVAVDSGHVYWALETGTTIGRANLDGTGVNTSFITGAIGPVGLAVSP